MRNVKAQIVKLNDEHEQPIRLWDNDGWYWNFASLSMSDPDNPVNGPYSTWMAAFDAANEFVNEA